MATARAFQITDEDIVSSGGAAAYATIDVPDDYVATLQGVEDYDNTSTGGSFGWKMTFEIEGLRFMYWVPFSDNAKWKLIETVNAFDPEFLDQRDDSGVTPPFDPEPFIGTSVGAHVNFEKDRETKQPDPNGRKVIWYLFTLVEDVADVPTL